MWYLSSLCRYSAIDRTSFFGAKNDGETKPRTVLFIVVPLDVETKVSRTRYHYVAQRSRCVTRLHLDFVRQTRNTRRSKTSLRGVESDVFISVPKLAVVHDVLRTTFNCTSKALPPPDRSPGNSFRDIATRSHKNEIPRTKAPQCADNNDGLLYIVRCSASVCLEMVRYVRRTDNTCSGPLPALRHLARITFCLCTVVLPDDRGVPVIYSRFLPSFLPACLPPPPCVAADRFQECWDEDAAL